MMTLIKVVEIWAPKNETQLTLQGAFYGQLESFAGQSKPLSFVKGEGLPGKVWETLTAIAAPLNAVNHFLRKDEARHAGLGSVLALPIVCNERLNAVVLLFFGNHPEEKGGVEVWVDESSQQLELTLSSAAYNHLDQFKKLSETLKLRRGMGLPAICWAKQRPFLIANLGDTYSRFLRAEEARRAGLTGGFAIPIETVEQSTQIVAMLSSHHAPIARQIEIWELNSKHRQFEFDSGFSYVYSNLFNHYNDVAYALEDDSPLAKTYQNRNATVTETPAYPGKISITEARMEPLCGLYLPIFRDNSVAYIVIFYL